MEETEEKSSKPKISVRWQYRKTLNHDFSFKQKRKREKETNNINTEKQTKRKKRKISNNKNHTRKDYPILSNEFLALNNF